MLILEVEPSRYIGWLIILADLGLYRYVGIDTCCLIYVLIRAKIVMQGKMLWMIDDYQMAREVYCYSSLISLYRAPKIEYRPGSTIDLLADHLLEKSINWFVYDMPGENETSVI